jgi:hypothetical protein
MIHCFKKEKITKEKYTKIYIMPTAKNWFQFIFINILCDWNFLFVILSFVKKIKADWPSYRCNPLFMPLSDNVQLDFNYCVQTMQKQMMGNFLQPISWILPIFRNWVENLPVPSTVLVPCFPASVSLVPTFSKTFLGFSMNLVIEIQKVTMGIKDMMQKIIGILATLVYVMDGTMKTMSSTWNGPIGGMVRGIGKMSHGSCFHPDTKIKLANQSIIAMKDVNLGDVLENGSQIKIILKIDNANHCTGRECYRLGKRGTNNEDILVTGSHYVMNETSEFVRVDQYRLAQEIPNEDIPSWFVCLITSDSRIVIGQETFWDYDDYFLRLNNP